MRRWILLLIVALWATGSGVSPVQAGVPAPEVSFRKAWIIAKGAAAEARFVINCAPEAEPVILDVGLNQAGTEDPEVFRRAPELPCTGDDERIDIPLPGGLDQGDRLVAGDADLEYEFSNCLERDPCFSFGGGSSVELARDDFVTPYKDDTQSRIKLIRSTLTDAGRVRVVYELTCKDEVFMPFGIESHLAQSRPNGNVVRGGALYPDDGNGLECGPDPQRLRYAIDAPGDRRFRPGVAFADTEFGGWFKFTQYATDHRPVRLAR